MFLKTSDGSPRGGVTKVRQTRTNQVGCRQDTKTRFQAAIAALRDSFLVYGVIQYGAGRVVFRRSCGHDVASIKVRYHRRVCWMREKGPGIQVPGAHEPRHIGPDCLPCTVQRLSTKSIVRIWGCWMCCLAAGVAVHCGPGESTAKYGLNSLLQVHAPPLILQRRWHVTWRMKKMTRRHSLTPVALRARLRLKERQTKK